MQRRWVLLDDRHQLRARADHAHLTSHDVDELWEFVEAVATQETTDGGVPRIVFGLVGAPPVVDHVEARGASIGSHRAELEHLERLAVETDALLPEQDRPAHRERDDASDRRHRHGGHDQRADGEESVEERFDQPDVDPGRPRNRRRRDRDHGRRPPEPRDAPADRLAGRRPVGPGHEFARHGFRLPSSRCRVDHSAWCSFRHQSPTGPPGRAFGSVLERIFFHQGAGAATPLIKT